MSFAFGKRANASWDAQRVQSLSRSGATIENFPDLGGGLQNKIYLWPSDGSTISTYDPNQAGVIAALAAAKSGDTVWRPSIEIACTAGITVPAGVEFIGISDGAILSFSGFSGAAVTLAAGAQMFGGSVVMVATGADAIGIDARAAGARVEHVDITVSGGSTRNVRVLAGVVTSHTLQEVWTISLDQNVILWTTTDGAAGSSPAWHTLALPTGYIGPGDLTESFAVHLQTDHYGHYLYVTGKDFGNSSRYTVWKLTNLAAIRATPATAPSWSAIAYGGMSTSAGTIDDNSFYTRCLGDTLYFRAKKSGGGASILGKYNGSSWTWRNGYTENGYQAVNGEVYAYVDLTAGSSYLYDWSDVQIGAAYTSKFGVDHFSEIWRRVDSVNHYHFPLLKPDDSVVLREQATGTEVTISNALTNSQDHATVRGAFTSDAVYCVDASGVLRTSAAGLSFSTIATWAEGWVYNTVIDGSGNLVWLVKSQTDTNPVLRLYDSGGLLSDLTGDLWTVLSHPVGTVSFKNLQVVYVESVTPGAYPIIADLHSGSATGTGAADVEVAGGAIILDVELATIQVDSGTAYVRDVAYTTQTGSGTIEPVQSDRGVWDALNYQARHANDIDEASGIHHTLADLDARYSTATALDDLTDVTITTPADGDVLTYDGAEWVNQAPSVATGGWQLVIADGVCPPEAVYYDDCSDFVYVFVTV